MVEIQNIDDFNQLVKEYIENDLLLKPIDELKFLNILKKPIITEIMEVYPPPSEKLDIMAYAIKNGLRGLIVELIRLGYNTYKPIKYKPKNYDYEISISYLVLASYYNLSDIVELLLYDGCPIIKFDPDRIYEELLINIYKNNDMLYLGKIIIDYCIKNDIYKKFVIDHGLEIDLIYLCKINNINIENINDETIKNMIINIINDIDYMVNNNYIKDYYKLINYVIIIIYYNSTLKKSNIKTVIIEKLKYLLQNLLIKYKPEIIVHDHEPFLVPDSELGILDLIAKYYNYDILNIIIEYCDENNIDINLDAISKQTGMSIVMSIFHERYDICEENNILSDEEKVLFMNLIKRIKNYDVCDIFNNDNLLHYAIDYNFEELVKYLIDKVNINHLNDDNYTCLDYAILLGNNNITNYLIDSNAIFDITKKIQNSQYYFKKDNITMLDALILNKMELSIEKIINKYKDEIINYYNSNDDLKNITYDILIKTKLSKNIESLIINVLSINY